MITYSNIMQFLNVLFIPLLYYIVRLEKQLNTIKVYIFMLQQKCPIFHDIPNLDQVNCTLKEQ